MYGQFDAKTMYLLTVFLFEAGSAICGAANTMDLLIFGRALCGLGGVGLYAGVMTLLSVTTTEHERPMYIGLTGLTWGLGTVLGPIIGGAFTNSSAGWRWGFCESHDQLNGDMFGLLTSPRHQSLYWSCSRSGVVLLPAQVRSSSGSVDQTTNRGD